MKLHELDDKGLDVETHTIEYIAKHHNVPRKQIKKELSMGIKIEMEHTTDEEIAREIALDHLYEQPDYYSKLKAIEK